LSGVLAGPVRTSGSAGGAGVGVGSAVTGAL
jgi:hypothetical protein